MKRFISIILNLCITLSLGIIPSISATDSVEVYTYEDIDTLQALIEEQESRMKAAHELAEAARKLDYQENHEVIELARLEWDQAEILQKEYKMIYDDLIERWKQKEEEYPAASYIWKYLKELGYSDYVCAGILGNIMAEAGGQTLNIQWYLGSSGYYGMCQWAKIYSTLPDGANLEEQCNYLRDTIKNQIDTFGFCYRRGFNYESFLELTDISQVALAFSKAYERCGSGSYHIRQINAINAYNYFIS